MSFGTDVTRAVCRRARGARRPPPAGRRAGVPRSRGDRDAARGAGGRSNGRTTSSRCLRRCAARCSRSATRSCSNTGTGSRGPFTRSACPPICPRTSSRLATRCACWPGCTNARNRRPVAETVGRLLDETRAHVGFALRRGGEQVLANVLHVAELARQYERNDGLSFRGFVEALRQAAERGDAAEAPIVEDGSDGVRLMTVHKAKGLEFPVVVLADITAKLATLEASRSIDVARGRCALRIGGWSPQDLLDRSGRGARARSGRRRAPGVRGGHARPRPAGRARCRRRAVRRRVGEPPQPRDLSAARRSAARPASAAGCPAFKKDSVLERPDGGIATAATVAPGAHRILDGERAYDVVWWDPGVAAPRRRAALRAAAAGAHRQGRSGARRRGRARPATRRGWRIGRRRWRAAARRGWR